MGRLRSVLFGIALCSCSASAKLADPDDAGAASSTGAAVDAMPAGDSAAATEPDSSSPSSDVACPFVCPSYQGCACLKDARGCDARVMQCTALARNACGTAQVVLCPGDVGVCDFAGACDPLRSDCQDFCPPAQPVDAGGVTPSTDADPAGCPAECPSNCSCLRDSAGCLRQGRCDGPPCGPAIVLCADYYVCDFEQRCDLGASDCREFCTE